MAKPKKKSGAKASRKPVGQKPRKKPVVRKDPLAEYRDAIAADSKATLISLGSEDCKSTVAHWFSTGSLAMDRLLNGRGVPAGKVTEVFGPPHVGKSTWLDHVMATCQKAGGVAALADTDFGRDANYTGRIGVDLGKLQMIEFDDPHDVTVENVIDSINLSVDFWARKHPDVPVVIGFDALGATATIDEMKKKLGATTVVEAEDEDGKGSRKKKENIKPGGAAKVMRQATRQLLTRLAGTKIAVIVVNHEYQMINMGNRPGKKRETYGGDALRHAATIRIEMYPLGWIKRGDGVVVGREVGVTLVKNRLGAPWQKSRFAILPGIGIDNVWDLFTHLSEVGVIAKTSAHSSWSEMILDGEQLKFQGWNGLQAKLGEDPALWPRLVSVYRQVFAPPGVVDA